MSTAAHAATSERASTAAASPVQTKLTVGKAGDSYEQEADRTAGRITGGQSSGPSAAVTQRVAPTISRLITRKPQAKLTPVAGSLQSSIDPVQSKLQRQEEEEAQPKLQRQEEEEAQPKLQRQEEEEAQPKLQRQEEEEAQPKLQRQEEEEAQPKLQRSAAAEEKEKPVQSKAEPRANIRDKRQYPVLNRVENKLFANKGRGEPIDKKARTEMEVGFGADFSAVRVHSGSDAMAMSREIKAQAFTHGKDIFFNSGKYEPESMQGKALLAHELTHVVQQGAAEQKLSADKVQENNARRGEAPPEPTDKQARQVEQAVEQKSAASDSSADSVANAAEPAAKAAPEPAESSVEKPAKSAGEAESREPPKEVEAENKGGEKKVDARKAKRGKGKGKGGKGKAGGGSVGAFLRQATEKVFQSKKSKLGELASNQKKKDPADEKLKQTESSVVPPAAEGQSRANAGQVATVEQAEAPQPDEQAAKQQFDQALENAVPNSLEEVDKFKEEGKGRVVGEAVKGVVSGDTEQVKATYQEVGNAPEPAAPESEPDALPEMEAAPETEAVDPGDGLVGSVQAEHTDFSDFENESDDMLKEEGIEEEHLAMVDEGDLAEANKERKQLKTQVKEGPAEVKAEEEREKQQVNEELKKDELEGRQKMGDQRQQALQGARGDQVNARSKLELQRQQVTDHINGIYSQANETVKQKLDDLEKQSLKAFDDGQAMTTKSFETNVNQRINAFKSRRYDRFGGSLLWAKDKLFGMDDLPEVAAIFESEKSVFITAIDGLVKTITAENKRVVQECRELVTTARKEIEAFVEGLGPKLRQTGADALKEMKGKLDALDQQINDKEKELQKKLAEKREAAIKAIEEKIEKMKEAMSGLISKLGNLLLEAMLKFFKWALKKAGYSPDQLMAIINKGKAVIKKIVGDPIAFIKNIVMAVKNGIGLFQKNIKKHLIGGMISWLTGAMADVPIQLPEKWDLKGILSLVLQILGLTWDRLRTKLVKRVGERVVKIAETSVDIVKRLISDGPIALWEMIKAKAGEIKQQVMEGIRNWAIVELVKQGIIKLVSFLNPAGAIVQAVLAIYNTVMFFVENWQRIAEFVKSVFNSIIDIAMGRLSKASQMVERAMAMTIPIILGFLGRLLGLSGIGKAITGIVKKIRKPIDNVVNKVLDKVVGFARKLMKKGKAAAGKVMSFILPKHRFKVGEESHTLSVKKSGDKRILLMSSTPTPIKTFLAQYEAKHGSALSTKKKAEIVVAKNFIASDIDPLLTRLGKLKETELNKTKINDLNRQILQKEVLLSGKVRTILGGTGNLKGTVEKYKLEGLAGTYGSMPKPPYDDLTADHQPQAAILVAAKNLPYFRGGPEGENMRARAANRAHAGYAVNLQSKRHMAGRTYGGKGGATKNLFLAKVKSETASLNKDQDKRNVVVNLIKADLAADVTAMRSVVANKENWKDLAGIGLSEPQENKLRSDTKAQILSGESRVASQDLDSLKG